LSYLYLIDKLDVMDGNIISFYLMGEYCVYVNSFLTNESWTEAKPIFIKKSVLDSFDRKRLYSSKGVESISSELKDIIGESSGFLVKFDEGYTFVKSSRFKFHFNKLRSPEYKRKGYIAITEFRLRMKNGMLESLSISEDSTFKDFLGHITSYALSDAYSLWIFDEEMRQFVFLNGTFLPEKDNIKQGVTCLDEVLEEESGILVRCPKDCDITDLKREGIQTIFRIKIPIQEGEVAIFSLYSKLENFDYYRDTLIDVIKSSFFLKLIERKVKGQKASSILVEKLLDSKKDMQEYLDYFCEQLAKDLSYQAVSVFLVDETRSFLEMKSSYNYKFHGRPPEPYKYHLHDKANTVETFIKEDYVVLYDLDDEWHSNIVNDPTESESQKSWIGAPIFANNNVIGVLRLKNKYHKQVTNLVAPTPIDRVYIKYASNVLSNYLNGELQRIELSDRADIERNNRRVFSHEVRNPILSINILLGNIEDEVGMSDLSEESKQSFVYLLKDIEAQRARFSFIIDNHTIQDKIGILSKQVDKVRLLHDIFYPIKNSIQRFYEFEKGASFDIDFNSLHKVSVSANMDLCKVVINSLIDNATKYLIHPGKPIRIWAEVWKKSKKVHIFVESYGCEILEKEKDLIFTEDGRGEKAIEMNDEGFGIGLWLCKKIMKAQGGDIYLDSRFDPVRFKLEYDLYEYPDY